MSTVRTVAPTIASRKRTGRSQSFATTKRTPAIANAERPSAVAVEPQPDRALVYQLAALGELHIKTARKILRFGVQSVKGEALQKRASVALRSLGRGDDGKPLAQSSAA